MQGGSGEKGPPPVGLPDVDGVFVLDVMFLRLLIQEVEEVLDGRRHRVPGCQHTLEEVVHKLLQRALWGQRGVHRLAQHVPGSGPRPAVRPAQPTLTDSRRVR